MKELLHVMGEGLVVVERGMQESGFLGSELAPSVGRPGYAGWVERHQLETAAVARRRDLRRLELALRRARRRRDQNNRAWARVRRAEARLRAAEC